MDRFRMLPNYFFKRVSGESSLNLINPVGNKPLRDYRIYGSGGDDELPAAYQRVKYIKSTGEQCIVTDYTPAQGDNISIESVECNRKSDFQVIFSAGTGDYQLILLIAESASAVGAYYKYFMSGAAHTVTERLDAPKTVFIQNGLLYYNDSLVATAAPVSDVNTPLHLFKRADDTSYASATMGRFTITNNSEIKIDLIPCYRKSDGNVGMYDLVNNVFYTSQGTSAFLKGEVVGTGVGDMSANLANLTYNYRSGATYKEYGNGYEMTAGSAGWGSYVTFNLGLENPWGKTYTVSAKIKQSNPSMTSMFRFGYWRSWESSKPNTWASFSGAEKYAKNGGGVINLTATLPETPPEDYDSSRGVSVFFNIQTVALDGYLGSITATDIMCVEGEEPADYTPYGKYIIPVVLGGEKSSIALDAPLCSSEECIDYKNQKIVWAGGGEESIEVPKIIMPSISDAEELFIDTLVPPSLITCEYYRKGGA